MKTNDLLANLKVASPCQARWSDMTGDDRARFCGQCQKHVYNFSGLSSDEIVALIRDRQGRLCARFYQRADGTMLQLAMTTTLLLATGAWTVGAAVLLFLWSPPGSSS